MGLLPKDPVERRNFIRRALTDTGFFARNVLGMNTDLDGSGNATSEVGQGGIRDWGPHQEMVSFFDNVSEKPKVFWAPRYSYKSSCVQAYLMRQILAHPEKAILLYMHDYEEAQERSAKMRDQMLSNEIIQEMMGTDLRGFPWKKGEWTTSLRSNQTIQQRQLTVASPKKARTGGRFNIIVFDDIVSETSFQTEAQRRQAIHCVESSINLEARGTQYLGIGTPYHLGDANHWMVNAGWEANIHLDVGGSVAMGSKGVLEWSGTPRWPNLSPEFLNGKLSKGMTYPVFMSQFMLKVVAGLTQAFQATDFNVAHWNREVHGDLTGYLLTDVAPSGSPRGDFNVLMYIGLDEHRRVFILDLEVGFWKMHEFCDRYLTMLHRWSGKVNHRAEVWEDSPSFHSYEQHLRMLTRESTFRHNIERAARNQTEKPKDERIAHSALRFQDGKVFVMDTVPRVWSTGTDVRTLWNPEGNKDANRGSVLPSGDLVDWFVQFPSHPKKDVPDTFSLVDQHDRKTDSPICYYVRPTHKRLSQSVRRKKTPNAGRNRTTRTGNRNGSSSSFYDRCWGRR